MIDQCDGTLGVTLGILTFTFTHSSPLQMIEQIIQLQPVCSALLYASCGGSISLADRVGQALQQNVASAIDQATKGQASQ